MTRNWQQQRQKQIPCGIDKQNSKAWGRVLPFILDDKSELVRVEVNRLRAIGQNQF